MISTTGKGFAVGALVFLALASAALLTPARVPVLKALGRDHAALRLERAVLAVSAPRAGASPAPSPAERAARLTALDNRFEAWDRRNARLSAFGLLGGVLDLWPWLFGLGVALPVLGALVGVQFGARPGSREPDRASPRHAVSSSAPPAPASETGADPAIPSPPPPPETWSWNAKPVARGPSARPKPPAVESPNADAV